MSSITDTLTPLMDKFRAKTGLTDKLTVARATSLMDHLDLHVNPNLLDATTYSVQSKQTDPYPEWNNLAVYQNLRADTTYTLTLSATSTNGIRGASIRLYKSNDDNNRYVNKQFQPFFFDADGKKHSFTFTTPKYEGWLYDVYLYAGSMGTNEHKDFVTTYRDCKLELGDLATPLTKVGGVTKLPLFAFLRGGARYAA